jgi:A/G-specific adenine glycosylase
LTKSPKIRSNILDRFQREVIAFYRIKGRKFYWRTNTLSPWGWLVLELLLKRTKAEAVERFFPSFIAKYHNPNRVIETSDLELKRELGPLGLGKQRCTAMKLIASEILKTYDGSVPEDEASLLSIPHIGLYISHAILCFCYEQRKPVVDSNVVRVLSRVFGLTMPTDVRERWIWEFAERVLPNRSWREYSYGLLDIGAMVCKSNAPKCPECRLRSMCIYAGRASKRRRQ